MSLSATIVRYHKSIVLALLVVFGSYVINDSLFGLDLAKGRLKDLARSCAIETNDAGVQAQRSHSDVAAGSPVVTAQLRRPKKTCAASTILYAVQAVRDLKYPRPTGDLHTSCRFYSCKP